MRVPETTNHATGSSSPNIAPSKSMLGPNSLLQPSPSPSHPRQRRHRSAATPGSPSISTTFIAPRAQPSGRYGAARDGSRDKSLASASPSLRDQENSRKGLGPSSFSSFSLVHIPAFAFIILVLYTSILAARFILSGSPLLSASPISIHQPPPVCHKPSPFDFFAPMMSPDTPSAHVGDSTLAYGAPNGMANGMTNGNKQRLLQARQEQLGDSTLAYGTPDGMTNGMTNGNKKRLVQARQDQVSNGHGPLGPGSAVQHGHSSSNGHPVPVTSTRPDRTSALVAETRRIASEFEYTDADVNRGVLEFLRQMNEGLEKDGTSLSQIPTYVTAVPNGTEKGLYMAVDLGGTNFRVCSIHLNGDATFSLNYTKVAIPKELMVAKTAEELFAFLARQIEAFLKTHHEDHFEQHVRRRQTGSTPEGYRDEHVFHLGFTFSFPVRQIGINKGTLIRWTKGFDIPDAIGHDVCKLLQIEIDKLHLPVKVAALVNDTVGTLMARSYTSPNETNALLGAIFGTGTNGAYIEKLSKIKKPLEGQYDDATGEMVVNTEWGSFDNELNVLPNTVWDKQLDRDSMNPGIQMFEKRVSGMFLGEIVRLVLVDMLRNPRINFLRDDNSNDNDWRSTTYVAEESNLLQRWGLDSAILSVAASDNTPELSSLRQELEGLLDIYSPALEDALAVKAVAAAIGRRAARLSAVAIAAIVLQSGRLTDPEWADQPIDVGVDGSLVEYYPYFRDMIYEALRVVDGIGPAGADRIQIGIAKDGSGVGAALIALVAANMEKQAAFREYESD